MASNEQAQETGVDEDRRKFLEACGKFAVVTPPAITLLLSTSLSSGAIASSGGQPSWAPPSWAPPKGPPPR